MIAKILTTLEAIPLLGKFLPFCYGLWLACKKDFRLIQNLKRPVMIIGSSGKDMNLIRALIKDAGFFRIEEPTNSAQSTDRIRNHSAVIIGYTKNESRIREIISVARIRSIPVIVYAAHGEIEQGSEDMKSIQRYSYAEIANTPFRLVNLLFAIFSTHKYD